MVYRYSVGNVLKHRRRRFRKRYPKLNSLADAAGKYFGLQKQVNILKGMINSELHRFNYQTTGEAITAAGIVHQLTDLAEGDDNANRTGYSVLHKYLMGRISVVMSATATHTVVRIVIVADTSNNGTDPAVTDVLTSANVYALSNIANMPRFTKLYDKVFDMDINGKRGFDIKVFRRTNFHVKYTGTAATDEGKNNIYLIWLSSESVNTPTGSIVMTSAFYDN